MATIKCGECENYYEIRKPRKSGEGFTSLKRGYCLHKTIFAKNKPGDHVYPVGARVEVLPNGQHDVTLVREDSLMLSCTAGNPRKE